MVFVVLLSVLMPLVVVMIVLFVVFGLNRKGKAQHPGWQPQQPPAGAAPRSAADPPAMGRGVWNAQVFGGGLIGALGGTLNSTFGRFILEEGTLAFLPDGADEPAWSVPCSQLFFTFNGNMGVAAVELRGPMGEVRCDVSVEHINRFTRNTFKTLRESRHARGFVNALAANGTRGV